MESSTSTSDEKLHESIIAALEHPTSDDIIIHEHLSCFYCEGWPCTCPNSLGTCSCPPNAAPSPSCVFYSPRIRDLLEGHTTEFETAQYYWTVVDADSAAEVEKTGEENRNDFHEVLVKHPEWGAFFGRFKDLEVGAKIGEGGQAEIFAASSQSFKHSRSHGQLVAKVWKEDVIIDYECSVGVTGTGFWRAPEILEQLHPEYKVVVTKEADIQWGPPSCFKKKKKEADIYSFGML